MHHTYDCLNLTEGLYMATWCTAKTRLPQGCYNPDVWPI